MKKIIVTTALALILTSCVDEKGALKSLEMDEKSDKYNAEFWSAQARKNSELWQQATAYCKDNLLKVNCVAIGKAAIIKALEHSDEKPKPKPENTSDL